MSKFELISYKVYPQDQYVEAIAKVRIEGKHIVSYALKKTKDGGKFWAPPSISITDNGEKKYVSGYMLDSRAEEEMLNDFIVDAVRQSQAKGSLSQASVFDARATPSSANSGYSVQTSNSGVAAEGEVLPF